MNSHVGKPEPVAADIVENAASVQQHVEGEIRAGNERLLEAFPILRYLELLDQYPEIVRWSYVSSAVKELCGEIRQAAGDGGLSLYHRAVLLASIRRFCPTLASRNFPEEIESRYLVSFQRVIRGIERKNMAADHYLYPRLAKDLGICQLRTIPSGMQVINLHRLPRSLFLRGPLRQWLAWVRMVVGMGGIGPLYEMHTHSDDAKSMLEFNSAGYTRLFERIAELLRRNPHVKGVVGCGWLNDPALEEVSPELAYMRTLITENGGRAFRAGTCSPTGIKDATIFSPKRKKLYEEGKYLPQEYVVVWPRKELLAWAGRRAAEAAHEQAAS